MYQAGVQAAIEGRLVDAVLAWEETLRESPDHAEARANLERARARLRADAERASPELRLRRARAALAEHRYAAARLELDRLLYRRPDDAEALLLRAETLRITGEADASLADAERALALRPADPAPLRAVGEAYRARGDRDRARYYLELFVAAAEPEPDLATVTRDVRAELGD
jgi:tetratricopeptide (TPR) repeat protein